MHELGLIKDLLKKVEAEVGPDKTAKVSKIVVQVSSFGGIKELHLQECFNSFVKGTLWDGTVLEVEESCCGAPLSLVNVEVSS